MGARLGRRYGPWRVCLWRLCPRKGVKFQAWDHARGHGCCSRLCGSKHYAETEQGRAYHATLNKKLQAARVKKRRLEVFRLSQGLSPSQAWEKGWALGYAAGWEMGSRSQRRTA